MDMKTWWCELGTSVTVADFFYARVLHALPIMLFLITNVTRLSILVRVVVVDVHGAWKVNGGGSYFCCLCAGEMVFDHWLSWIAAQMCVV